MRPRSGPVALVIFLALSLLLMRDLLGPGFLLTLDSLYALYRDPTTYYGIDERSVTAGAPLYIAINTLKEALPLWAIERALLVATLALAGLGAFQLAPTSTPGKYFAGFLYAANPYTYERLIAGHWGLLLGYALTPFALKAFIQLLSKRGLRNSAIVGLLTTLVAIPSIHQLIILLLMYLVLLVAWLLADGRPLVQLKPLSLLLLSVGLIFVALNAYWIVPSLTTPATILDEITEKELTVFATRGFSSWGDLFDAAALYGFWRVSPTVERPGPLLHIGSFLPVLFLAVFTVVNSFTGDKNLAGRRWLVWGFLTMGLLSLLFVLGDQTQLGSQLLSRLWDHIPIVRGFREPQKFSAALALSYAFLGGLAIRSIERWILIVLSARRRFVRGATLALALGVPVAFSYSFFASLGNQLGTVRIPDDWHQVQSIINQTPEPTNVLILPWQHYMAYPWLPNREKVLANPARRFFNAPVIMGDDLGIGTDTISNPISRYVANLLRQDPPPTSLGASLLPLGARYVVLFHAASFENDRQLLSRQEDLRLLLEGPTITLYENTHPVSRFYGLTDSEQQTEPKLNPLDYTTSSPVSFEVRAAEYDRIAFVPLQNSSLVGWKYNGHDPQAYLRGFLPVFEGGGVNGTLNYDRFFQVYAPFGILSSLALGVVLVGILSPAVARLAGRIREKPQE